MASRDYSGICKGLVDLVIQFLPVGNNDECPVARHLPQYLLREKDHGNGLAAPLRMPEYAETFSPSPKKTLTLSLSQWANLYPQV